MTDLPNKLIIKDFSFIKNDLKRLKRLKGLEEEITNALKIVQGLVIEQKWRPPQVLDRALITVFNTGQTKIYCFKRNVPVPRVGLMGNKGCRLIYGIDINNHTLRPLLVYAAKEEDGTYTINNKKPKLQLTGIKEILREKFNSC